MVRAEGNEKWLGYTDITRILQERDEARAAKDYATADSLMQQLKDAEVRIKDKQKGHLWGTWLHDDGRCGQLGIAKGQGLTELELSVNSQVQSRHVAFWHDSTKPWPAWVVNEGVHEIDLIVANPPWGKNIGTKEDGIAIVRNLVEHFSGSTCIMALLVSKGCFEQLAVFNTSNDIYAWHLVPDVFAVKDRVVSSESSETKEWWSLIYHAEIGQSVLMVMGWVNEKNMMHGKVHGKGYMQGFWNTPGMQPRHAWR